MARPAAARERPATVRCAIYTRKSTSHGLEQEFNSLDAQREYCDGRIRERAHDGWKAMADRYDDGGYTGANTDRPAFQRLMTDVESGKVNVVVVYKVDRLCRSLLDFARVMERFNRAGVAFVSVTQNFSTADAMGRLTLNMLMSFAEFEREMIAERTRDKIRAARRRGKWTGGVVLLGYRVEDKQLLIDEVTAPLAREVFDLYLELESAVAVAARLNETAPRFHARSGTRGTARPRRWTKNDVLRILQSPVYAGLMVCGDELHEGEHAALIPRPRWQQVQAVLAANRTKGRQRARNPSYFLRGVLHCAACGGAMTPASTRRADREYRYYRCVTREKGGRTACAAPSLAAEQIERTVEVELRRLSVSGAAQEAAFVAAHADLTARREAVLAKRTLELSRGGAAATEADGLAARLASCAPEAQAAIERRIASLYEQQTAAEQRRASLERDLGAFAAAIERLDAARSIIATIDRVWPRLTPANRARLVRTLVERVEVSMDGQVRIDLINGRADSLDTGTQHAAA